MILSIILLLALAPKPGDDLRTQSTATTVQSFTAVEGADLMSKLDAAQARGRTGRTPYWSAYTFDVRPGVGVDPAVQEFHGNMSSVGDTTIFVGTTASGVPVETRSLAIFLLREPAGNQIVRMEIYNLERKREYSGYPVYWLGRANNEESLNYLRALAAAAPLDSLSLRAVLGIALHDDARVGGMLENFVTSSPNPRTRSAAVYWLGQTVGEQAFLATLVRNENEEKQIRRTAANAIGESNERGRLATLKALSEEVKDPEVRRSVINAASFGSLADRDEAQAAISFLAGIAKNDSDLNARRSAVMGLGRFQRDEAADELMKIYANDPNPAIKQMAVRSLAETNVPKARARVLDIARNETNLELRREAIRALGSCADEATTTELLRLFDSEQNAGMRQVVLRSVSEIKSPRVEDKLFEVARTDQSADVRREAIRALGERVSKRSFEFLSTTAQSNDANIDVQVQAVRAIGERHSDDPVPLLIKIARTHPNQRVRKQAIRSLGETGDQRAVEFFRELLTK